MSSQTLMLDDEYNTAQFYIKNLDRTIKRIEFFENREIKIKKLDRPPKDKMAGINRRQTGTYGN